MSTTKEKRFEGIDYGFRPASYWNHDSDPLAAILRNVKGANRRRMIRDFWENGQFEELEEGLLGDELSDETRHILGLVHPSFMGGEYLPDCLPFETEIARIELESTTADVISIRARPTDGGKKIGYRIVDEYDTDFFIRPEESAEPLSLEELIGLIDNVGSEHGSYGGLGICFNLMNAEGGCDPEELRDFTTVSSDIYSDLYSHYDEIHEEWVAASEPPV